MISDGFRLAVNLTVHEAKSIPLSEIYTSTIFHSIVMVDVDGNSITQHLAIKYVICICSQSFAVQANEATCCRREYSANSWNISCYSAGIDSRCQSVHSFVSPIKRYAACNTTLTIPFLLSLSTKKLVHREHIYNLCQAATQEQQIIGFEHTPKLYRP